MTTTNQTRFEARAKLHKSITQNLSRGKYAVAIIGRVTWERDEAIGDGITTASMSLVTRCETLEQAKSLAAELNDLEPGVMPGSGGAWVFEAVPYRRNDYIGQQNIDRSQTRDVDRRVANL